MGFAPLQCIVMCHGINSEAHTKILAFTGPHNSVISHDRWIRLVHMWEKNSAMSGSRLYGHDFSWFWSLDFSLAPPQSQNSHRLTDMFTECSAGHQAVLDVACPVDILILSVRNGNAPVNGIPSALKSEPQHAMESFLDIRRCPKSG